MTLYSSNPNMNNTGLIQVGSGDDEPQNGELTKAQAKDVSENMKAEGGTWRTSGDGTIDHDGNISINRGLDESNLEGVMSSIRTRTGRPVNDVSQINDATDTIEVQGVRTSVKVALNAGLLVRDANGILYDPTGPRPNTPEYEKQIREQDKPTEVREVSFKGAHYENQMQLMKSHSSGGSAAVDAGVDRVLVGIANGDEGAMNAVNDLAELTGGDVNQIEILLNEMIQTSAKRAAAFYTQSTGEAVEIAAVTDMVFENCSPRMRQAFLRSIYYNDLNTFGQIISDLKLGNFK